MTQPKRLRLAYRHIRRHRLERAQFLQLSTLALALQRCLQFRKLVKVIFDTTLAAAVHENNFLDPSRNGFLYNVLQCRFIDNWQHLFWYDFAGRQHPRPKAVP